MVDHSRVKFNLFKLGLKINVMPIAVEAVSLEKYLAWLNEQE